MKKRTTKKPPKSKVETVLFVRLTKELKIKYREFCKERGISMNERTTKLIKDNMKPGHGALRERRKA